MSEAHAESHSMAHDHHGTTPAEDDNTDLRAVTIWYVGICVAVVVLVVFIWQYFSIQVRKEMDAKVFSAESTELREVRAAEQAQLTKYQWVDKNAGVVRIPLERAKELTLRDWDARRAKAAAAAAAAATEGAEAAPTEATPAAQGAN